MAVTTPQVVLSVRIKGDKTGPQTGDVVLGTTTVSEWSETDKYEKGEMVVHMGDLCYAKVEIPVPEPWDETKWMTLSRAGDYDVLLNKPQINGNELNGDMSWEDLGIPDYLLREAGEENPLTGMLYLSNTTGDGIVFPGRNIKLVTQDTNNHFAIHVPSNGTISFMMGGNPVYRFNSARIEPISAINLGSSTKPFGESFFNGKIHGITAGTENNDAVNVKQLNDGLNTKASASSVTALTTRMNNVETKNTTQDSRLSTLETDMTNKLDRKLPSAITVGHNIGGYSAGDVIPANTDLLTIIRKILA